VDDKAPPGSRRHKAPRTKTADPTRSTSADPPIAGSPAPLGKSATPESATEAGTAPPEAAPPAKAPVPLQLACEASEKEAAPGQKLQINCDATNLNDTAIRLSSIEVIVGTGAAQAAVGEVLSELAPHSQVRIVITPTLPRNAKAGEPLPIMIVVNTPDATPVQRPIAVQIVQPDQLK